MQWSQDTNRWYVSFSRDNTTDTFNHFIVWYSADTDSLLYLTVTQYPQQLPTQQTKLKLMSKLITRCDLLWEVPKLMLNELLKQPHVMIWNWKATLKLGPTTIKRLVVEFWSQDVMQPNTNYELPRCSRCHYRCMVAFGYDASDYVQRLHLEARDVQRWVMTSLSPDSNHTHEKW